MIMMMTVTPRKNKLIEELVAGEDCMRTGPAAYACQARSSSSTRGATPRHAMRRRKSNIHNKLRKPCVIVVVDGQLFERYPLSRKHASSRALPSRTQYQFERAGISESTHTRRRAHTRARTHKRPHTRAPAQTHTQTNAHARRHTTTHTHTRTQAHAHAHAHAHTHA